MDYSIEANWIVGLSVGLIRMGGDNSQDRGPKGGPLNCASNFN